jgi:hypothetical protein
MTTEELIVAGLPAEPEVQEPGTSQPAEDKTYLLLVDLGTTRTGRLDQRRRIWKISTLI